MGTVSQPLGLSSPSLVHLLVLCGQGRTTIHLQISTILAACSLQLALLANLSLIALTYPILVVARILDTAVAQKLPSLGSDTSLTILLDRVSSSHRSTRCTSVYLRARSHQQPAHALGHNLVGSFFLCAAAINATAVVKSSLFVSRLDLGRCRPINGEYHDILVSETTFAQSG